MKKRLKTITNIFLCFVLIGMMFMFYGCSDSEEIKTDANNVIDNQSEDLQIGSEDFEPVENIAAVAVEELESIENTETEKEDSAEDTDEMANVEDESAINESEEVITEENSVDEESKEQTHPLDEIKEIRLADLDIYGVPEYEHRYHTGIYIGNDEGIIFSVVSTIKDISAEDLCIGYNEEYLTFEYKEAIYNDTCTILRFYATGKKEGDTEISFSTKYDSITQKENKECKTFAIKKLNPVDGKVVYTTPNGKKYHFSVDCPGENAQPTVMLEVDGIYGPCKKCVH